VFKTTDYGRHWSVLTNGLPNDQSVFIVREDPDDGSLLFLGNANSVYASFNGGSQWQPLGMGLPHAQVRDIAIDTRQGEVVAATHGRSFWILDNLSLLEQWARQPNPPADAARLYAPQTAWLTHAYGRSEKAEYRGPIGINPPYGATVFFHIPATYDGKTPASLEILDDQGHAVRHYTLHLKKKEKKLPRTVEDNLLPSQEKHNAEQKLTAISAGMNSLQWNLRYDDATDVIGFEPPEETDDLTADASGPLVNPGRYTVVLHYGGESYRQPFQVSLDPRLYTTAAALKQHLALQLELHQTIDTLDRTLNSAIQTRQRLARAVAAHKIDAATAAPALDALHEAIDDLVQLNVRSSEGDVLHEMHLRSLLAYMQSNVSLDYGPPDASMIAECRKLEADARRGEAKLQAATAAGQRLL
jgi:chorismate mutase